MMGDFNADCSYVSKEELENLYLRVNKSFVWLIPDDFDTTTGSSICAYNR